MNVSCPHCHRPFAVQKFEPGGSTSCPHCLRNVMLPSEQPVEAVLIPLEGEAANSRIPLSGRMVIGRSNDADIQVLDSNISRQHAEILFDKGRFVVRDLGSRNGVIVNEARVGEGPLKNGDVLRMGGRNFRFELVGVAAPASMERTAPLRPPDAAVEQTSPGSGKVPRPRDPLPNTSIGRKPVDKPLSLSGQPPPPASMASTMPELAGIDADRSNVRTELSADDIDLIVGQVGEGAAARAAACLQTVYRVSEALVGVVDIDAVCKALLEQVVSAVPADRAYVILKNDAGEFAVRAAKYREERHADNQMMVSSTLVRRVVEEHVSLLVADAQVDMQAAHSIVAQGIRSVMCVPLAIGKSGFGAISVDTLRSKNAFDDSDLKMLTAIGRQASIALENLRLMHQVEENARTRGILERYLPPELIEQVVQRKVDLKPGGQLTELTILFSDIRGFTQLAKGMDPEAVVELINEYFSIMVEVLFKHGATLDKFIGDSIMAFWGAPVKRPDDAQRAVRCALEMQEKLAQFNQLMVSSGQQELAVGIGINTGEAVAGNIGSMRRFEYTILGDAVNVASRMQSIAKGGEVLITAGTLEKLGGAFQVEAREAVELKGRSGLVGVYSVLA